jgi:soluble lytic murein transglycosylase
LGAAQILLSLTLATTALHAQKPAPTPEEQAREAFRTGVKQFQDKKFDEARTTLSQLPELGGYLALYKHWYLGQSLIELGKYKEAEPEVAKVIQSQASSEMKYQAQFLWGEIALRQQKYSETIARLSTLERKWRHSYRYPEVLYRLMAADLRLGKTANACKYARKLYAKYPAHALVIGWGSDLHANEVDGKKLPCKAEKDDFSDRVRSLQWAGESEKAHKEIVDLMGRAPEAERRKLDMTLAAFMVNEGNVDDALNLLIRYFPQEKGNMAYLMLLGRAAARSGEYQTAVGAFERANRLEPRSKKGREALYQAAYMSYQFQDYDGAVRKFQEFVKANPKSGLAKDAQWHLAWLQYLRNDYKGALEKFEQVKTGLKARRKKSDSLQERLLYWMAMAHIRLNELQEARTCFEQIVANNAYSYYGLAAQARLENVVAKLNASSRRLPASATPAPAVAATPAPAPAAEEEKESEEDIAEDNAAPAGDQAADEDDGDEEHVKVSDFKDPALRARIDVANKLIQLGLPDLAKWELWEVERHTRNMQYLRLLIAAYEGIGSFNRSAAIADLSFGKEREAGGFDGARAMWLSAYPQAYKAQVTKQAKNFGIAPEWVWAIMRTESMYKADVISPVGAKGLMQLMQYTARNLAHLAGDKEDDIDLLNTDTNIKLGTQYLARLGTKFKGQLALVAAAYNAGPHRVEGWLVNFGNLEADEFVEHIPFLETRNYVKKVVRYNTFYRRLYAKDQKPVEYLAKTLGVPIPSRASTRESWDSL